LNAAERAEIKHVLTTQSQATNESIKLAIETAEKVH